MATVATEEVVDVNGRDVRTESLLTTWKIPFRLDPEFALAKVKVSDIAQVREDAHRAPRRNVDEYAAQMSAGAKFPPIVLTEGGLLIVDGNTRLAAAQKNGHMSFSGICCEGHAIRVDAAGWCFVESDRWTKVECRGGADCRRGDDETRLL